MTTSLPSKRTKNELLSYSDVTNEDRRLLVCKSNVNMRQSVLFNKRGMIRKGNLGRTWSPVRRTGPQSNGLLLLVSLWITAGLKFGCVESTARHKKLELSVRTSDFLPAEKKQINEKHVLHRLFISTFTRRLL